MGNLDELMKGFILDIQDRLLQIPCRRIEYRDIALGKVPKYSMTSEGDCRRCKFSYDLESEESKMGCMKPEARVRTPHYGCYNFKV